MIHRYDIEKIDTKIKSKAFHLRGMSRSIWSSLRMIYSDHDDDEDADDFFNMDILSHPINIILAIVIILIIIIMITVDHAKR